jgi:predicted RNase H-like HicB family nuclease
MYWADVSAHPGLFASGESLDELAEALAEAWALYSHGAASPTGPRPALVPSDERRVGRVDQLTLLVPV